jgi:D-alanine--poly(phosphoribitol) ligase subunit 1
MNQTMYGLFTQVVKENKNQIAIIEDNRQMTFSQLLELTDRMADTFPEHVQTVGIVMDHRAEMIAAMLATLKCGARYVPAEPTFPTGRIQYMMEEAKVDFIVTEEAYISKLDGFPIRLVDDHSFMTSHKPQAQPDSPAYVLYTSGTTGKPKGVCVTNQNVCHYVQAFAGEFHPTNKDIMLQYSVCSFDIFVEEVFASLLNGMAIAIPSPEDKSTIQTLMQFVDTHHITMMSGFPYLFAEMNHLDKIPHSLRLLISGGDVLRASYVDHLLNQVDVYNTYGPSETTVCASYYHCNTGHALADGTYPVGHAVKGTTIRILDETGQEVKPGETGEICIYGNGVSNGYIGDHFEENQMFVSLEDGSKMYHSGDLGYILPDGNIAFLHRKDSQIMIYGKRVEVKEVESCLYQCEHIQQAVVQANTDEHGLSYMTAYIVAEPDLKVSNLKKELAQNLTSFMIPEFFVKMKEIPLNANGKPDVSQLPIVMKEGRV